MVSLQVDIKATTIGSRYTNLLNKVKDFLRYSITVGIHSSESQKKVVRKYIGTNGASHKAGYSSIMNVGKLAYMNEHGADIIIPERFTVRTRTHKFMSNLKEKYKSRKRKQGFLLLNSRGEFIMYKKPNSVIKIPARPFCSRVVDEFDITLSGPFNQVLSATFSKGGGKMLTCMRKIAKLTEERMKYNVSHQRLANHEITIKNKGFNRPLYESQDRIRKNIKSYIYKDKDLDGTPGYILYSKRNADYIDQCKKTATDFENFWYISKR